MTDASRAAPDQMPDAQASSAPSACAAAPPAPGNSLARGVVTNWAAYAVYVASGFLLPRLIGDRMGQHVLGLWDFAWSLVAYAGMLSMGVDSAASRYVARFRARGEWAELSRMVSSAAFALACSFLVACVLAGAFVMLTPVFLADAAPDEIRLAQQLVAVLGFNTAMLLPLGLFNGVLSGLQRFDVRNAIRCGVHLSSLGVMVVAILLGRGLLLLALIELIAEALTGLLQFAAARRLCPELRLSLRMVSLRAVREALGLGGKTVLQGAARSGLYHANGLIVTYFLGPAMLAVYARQRALVVFAVRLLNQYANVFGPAASRLEATGDAEALRGLVIRAARFGYFIALPVVAFLAVMGGPLVSIWMGPRYAAPWAIGIMAAGHVVAMAHAALFQILSGLNLHGRSAAAEVASAAASVGVGILLVGVLDWGITGAALAVALCVTVGGGLVPARDAARRVALPLREFWRRTLPGPLLAATPFLLALLAARAAFPASPVAQLAAGVGAGGLLLAATYWRFVLTDSLRDRFRRSLGLRRRRGPVDPAVRPAADGRPRTELLCEARR